MPLRPASDYDKLSAEDEKMVEELLEEMDKHFAGGAGAYYVNTNTTPEIPQRVWKEVVRRANEAGYVGSLRGAIVELQRP